MTELEKLKAGLNYCLWDEEIIAMKKDALMGCEKLNAISPLDDESREAAVRELFGNVGKHPSVYPGFHCDCGNNIYVGDNFLANYNVTILDRGPVRIGNNVLIGPGTVITTTGHPVSMKGRRDHLGFMKPVIIGDDVWIGANATILPGVTIGKNVVIAAGAVVHDSIPDNCMAAGVPAVTIKELKWDMGVY